MPKVSVLGIFDFVSGGRGDFSGRLISLALCPLNGRKIRQLAQGCRLVCVSLRLVLKLSFRLDRLADDLLAPNSCEPEDARAQ
jgi:hypothetical protein